MLNIISEIWGRSIASIMHIIGTTNRANNEVPFLPRNSFVSFILLTRLSGSHNALGILKDPLSCLFLKFTFRKRKKRTNNQPFNPVDTGRKLNVHKTFRRRPVSTGNAPICCYYLKNLKNF